MRILVASSEAVPFAKTGGLADVAGSLLKEFRRKRLKASLVMPLYGSVRSRFRLNDTGIKISVPMGNFLFEGEIFTYGRGKCPEAIFIACDQFFGRPELYGTASSEYSDNAIRFIFFSRAVLEACMALDISPDVVHCNDWQTGMIPLYLKTLYAGQRQFSRTSTLFTIHNLGYQGNYDAFNMTYTGLGWDFFVPARLEFYGRMSLLKAGLLYADTLNTVSITYAHEILTAEHGFSMDGVLSTRMDDLYGITNGIDYHEWDPANDPYLPAAYDAGNIKGKAVCRSRLARLAGFREEKAPIAAIVSRLSYQKGLDIFLESIDEMVSLGINIVLLGKGEEHYESALSAAAERHRGRVYVHIGFEEPFAHLIYAGADLFLMPSRYEPCGIGQLIAMRYGTLPVARRTGGLADTITDYDHLSGSGTGVLFNEFSSDAMTAAIKRGLCLYAEPSKMRQLARSLMLQDFSWDAASDRYIELYRRLEQKA